jgi:hypothetical protein
MSNYAPYKFWCKTHLADHLKELTHQLSLGKEIRHLIEASMVNPHWDPINEFDGCSVVQDTYHPCLSCFIHDYLWRTGQGGKESDELFYLLMLAEGTSKARAKRRWLAVRLGWLFYYKWNHISMRDVNAFTDEFKRALVYMKTI